MCYVCGALEAARSNNEKNRIGPSVMCCHPDSEPACKNYCAKSLGHQYHSLHYMLHTARCILPSVCAPFLLVSYA